MKTRMTVRLKINSYEDRIKVIQGLTASGYPSWVEQEEKFEFATTSNFFVCFSCSKSEVKDDQRQRGEE